MKNKKIFFRTIIALVLLLILLGVWISYQVKASTQLTIDDCPYNIEFVKIDTRGYLSMGIDTEGNLWGWGYSYDYNILGEEITGSKAPIQIKEGTKFKEVTISNNGWHVLAIDTSGNLWAWGDNSFGQLGDGTTQDKSSPVKIKSGTKFSKISAGAYNSFAIDTSGNLWGWGAIRYETTTKSSTPIQIMSGTTFTQLSVSGSHVLAIDTSGNLWTWGENNYGQLGDGTTTQRTSPVQIMSGTTFSQVSTGYCHSLAIDSSGNLWSWGDNENGQLGDGTTTQRKSPVKIKSGVTFKNINCGESNLGSEGASFAIDTDGNLWSWGNNTRYWLGNGSTENGLEPQKIMEGKTFKDVSAGVYYAIAIDINGDSYSWGWDAYNARGTGTIAPYNIAVRFAGTDYVVTFKDGEQVVKEQNVKLGKTAIAPLITKEGYTLSWDNVASGIMDDLTVNAIWTKNVNYKIEHYIQNENKDGYILKETETKTGPIGINAMAKSKAYEGYRENTLYSERVNEGIIVEDGSLVLKLYYDKLYFTKEDLSYNINFKEISASDNFAVAIDENGRLWTWGKEYLGDGNSEIATTPIQVKSDKKFVKVSAGLSSVIAIAEDGTLWGWGKTGYSNTEEGETITSNIPIQLNSEMKFKDISVGNSHNLAIDETGNLWAWGNNGSGQLGDGTTYNSIVLIQIMEGTTFSKISAGRVHSMAIDSEGNLWTWGYNRYGQLGNETTTDSSTPIQIKSGTTFSKISAGYNNSMAIDSEGNLWVWGNGNLGDETTTKSLVPIQIMPETTFEQILAGYSHSMAIDSEGNLWTWGSNSYGQLGDGTTTTSKVPIQIMLGTKFSKISASSYYSMAIDKDGNLWAWGDNSKGQLGVGESSYLKEPTKIKNEINFVKIANSGSNVLAIDSDGNLWAWGTGYLGDGTTSKSSIPIQIMSGTKFKQISLGREHSMAIDASGNLWTWGSNSYGQLGNGTSGFSTNSNIPIQIKSGTTFTQIAAGEYYSIAIDSEGNLWTWGYNNAGQLGNGTSGSSEKSTIPIQIMPGTTFKQISAGYNHSIALDSSGNLWTWGYNYYGQLGNGVSGMNSNSSTPIQIKSGTTFIKISAGEYHSMAIDSEGNLWTWGNNGSGQLGDGTNEKRVQAVQVMTGTKFNQISAGSSYSMAIDSEGNLWTWGNNSYGQLGDGTTTYSRTPIQIMTGTTFTQIAATYNSGSNVNSLALTESGDLFMCGYDYNAMSGVSYLNQTSTPIQITGKQTYTVTFKDGEEIIDTQTIEYGTGATAPTLTKAGYTLTWNKDFSNVTSDLTVNAVWTANTNTAYKVEHYKQNTTLNGYELAETENLTGTTDTTATAIAKTYTGFTENTSYSGRIASGNIAGDGSLVLKLYYNRNSYEVTLNTNEGTINSGNVTSYIYGIGATLPTDVTKTGYTFAGWYNNEELTGEAITTIGTTETGNKGYFAKWTINQYTVTFKDGEETVKTETVNYGLSATATVLTKAGYTLTWDKDFSNVTRNITVNAVWTANTNTAYKVEHYKQNTTLDGYELAETENLTGTTDTLVTAIAKTYTGFTENTSYSERVPSGTIVGDESLVLKLYYDRNSYAVTLNTNAGTINSGNVTSYIYGIGATLPTDVTKTGYTFAGWYNNEELTGEAITTIGTTETGNKGYFAKWTINQYTVTFKDGEETVKTETVNYGLSATAPELTKTGYILSWDKDFSNVTSDLTVNAIWTANTSTAYKVEHYKQNTTLDGYELAETENLTGTTDTTAIAVAKTYTGFTENTEYSERVPSGNIAGDGSLVLKLYYDRNSYEVTLNTNEGTINSGNVTSYTYGIGATLPTDVTKTGYTFAGWYANEELTGEAITTIGTTETGNKEYFAKWTQNQYTVTFKDGENTVKTETVNYGSGATAPALTKAGYTLSWDKEFSNVTGNITVNAVWTANTNTAYKVEHYLRNLDLEVEGYYLAETENLTGTTDTLVTATAKTYEGFTENTSYSGRITSGNIAGDGSLVLKLYYNRNSYSITYELNGGEATITLTDSYTYGKEMILSTRVTKTGHIFEGWYNNSEFTGSPITKITSTDIGNKTFYAKWIQNEFTVTFKNGEDTVKTETVISGSSATAPEVTKAGYTLSWDKDFSNVTSDLTVNAIWTANANTAYKVEHYKQNTTLDGYELAETENLTGTTDTTATAVAKTYTGFTENTSYSGRIASGNIEGDGSLVLKLYYDRNSYTVTLNTNDGIINSGNVTNYTYGIETTLPTNVTKEGYVFLGWYDNENLTGEAVTTIGITEIGEKIFYAKWSVEDEYYIISEHYNIDAEESYITKVSPDTDVTTLISKLNTNGTIKIINLKNEEVIGEELIGTGFKLQTTFNGVVREYKIAVRGDLDGNGKITVTDLSMINQVMVDKLRVEGARKKAADIDYNGKTTVTDLSMINQAMVGKLKL